MYDPRTFEKKKTQPEIPAEKQRLAASLFGGSSSQKAANGGAKVLKPAATLRPGEIDAPPRPGLKGKILNAAAQSKQAPSPLMDLMDMSEGDLFPAPVAKPSYDPFKELESLLDGPSSSTTAAPPKSSNIDFMSLFDSTPVASSTSDPDILSLSHTSSSGMMDLNGPQAGLLDLNELPVMGGLVQQPSASSSTEKKGPSLQNSLQKDAASRQVGVTPTGANPALFQDIFG